jgi:hypothetical protein
VFFVVTAEEQERQKAATMRQFEQHCREAAEREKAREAWRAAHACPHCGRTDPYPVQLLY